MPAPLQLQQPTQQSVKQPVWQGPESDGPQGGVTQGMIARWLVDRERFRLYVMEGLRRRERFDHKKAYGDMFHACEEGWLADRGARPADASDPFSESRSWMRPLDMVTQRLAIQFPMDRQAIDHWYWVCRTQFPVYVEKWNRHSDADDRIPMLQEHAFRVPIVLPSGRTVWLRGKLDAVDLFPDGIWLTDHKTKGDLDTDAIAKQLRYDLQVMTYLKALQLIQHDQASDDPLSAWTKDIRGVRYNCVRRPLSGGKGSIRQGKTEAIQDFYARLGGIIRDDPGHYFVRFNLEVTEADIAKFVLRTLAPVLENVCDDYEWWVFCHANDLSPFDSDRSDQCRECLFPHHVPRHYMMPFGVYSPLMDGGDGGEIDEYLLHGSDAGLMRTDDLFPELRTAAAA